MKWLHTNAYSMGNKQEEMVATAQLLSVDIYYSGEAGKEWKVMEMSSMQKKKPKNTTKPEHNSFSFPFPTFYSRVWHHMI